MKPEYLYAFYEYVILPQFGIESHPIYWQGSQKLGPDEMAYSFSMHEHGYMLIFEDFDGLGRSAAFIVGALYLSKDDYEFVQPTARTDVAPSLNFTPRLSYKYAENITGTFTLLKLRQAPSAARQAQAIRLDARNNAGWVRTNKAAE